MTPALGVKESGIARAAVIGAGAMGSGIAAQFANAGVPVDLLDIAGDGDRDGPARAGIARQIAAGGFMDGSAAALVRPGNLDDHLDRLATADWIVEAVIEDLAIKRALFARIAAVRRPGCVVSSNTSTIPRAALVHGLPADFARDVLITHFFNPPRHMRLVELVVGPDAQHIGARAGTAARVVLGKDVVPCRDTPGFIANRIGCFWIAAAALKAARMGLTVEEADAVHAALGIPRTGVFGLLDLVGLDLVPHVWGSLMATLPATDALQAHDLPGWAVIRDLLAQGRFGRKTGAGFYRKGPDGTREALDLATGTYRPLAPVDPQTLPGGGRDVAALVTDSGRFGRYAAAVLSQVLAYAAEHGPDIAGDVGAVDVAMELGYSWREGPFRLAERAGLRPLAAALDTVPPLLSRGLAEGFYRDGQALYTSDPGRAPAAAPAILTGAAEVLANPAASLRDLGEGVACFRLDARMGTFSPAVLDLLEPALDLAARDFRALVLAGGDGRGFSAGADLAHFAGFLDRGDTAALDRFVARGQNLFLAMKYLSVPVVAAVHGVTLGGGCEFALHADRIIAHAEANIGLPEARLGLLPGWGGCTQLLLRHHQVGGPDPLAAAFDALRGGLTTGSALQARAARFLRPGDGIVMHAGDLIPAAKAAALAMAKDYTPPPQAVMPTAAATDHARLMARIDAGAAEDERGLASAIADVLCGGAAGYLTEADMMALERRALVTLAAGPAARARIAEFLRR